MERQNTCCTWAWGTFFPVVLLYQFFVLAGNNSFTPHPSLSPYWWTEIQTEKRIHLLRVAWRNIFPVVLLCQFLVLVGNRFWFYLLCTYVLRVQYSCGVILAFWFWREIVFGVTLYNTVVRLCQFFGCGRKLFSKWEHVSIKNLIGLLFMIR